MAGLAAATAIRRCPLLIAEEPLSRSQKKNRTARSSEHNHTRTNPMN